MCKTNAMKRQCQWCSTEFETNHPSKMFCSSQCKNDFASFTTVLGKRIAPIALTWRSQRGRAGEGSAALKELCALLDQGYAEYLGDTRTQKELEEAGEERGRRARPIVEHFRKVRESGTGVTLARDRR